MEVQILDQKFQTQAIIDAFESFIWTDRYNKPGDFEIYMPISKAPMEYVKRDNYIWIKDSDRLQVIEDIEIETDSEDGDHLKITGRTLESFLDRRIVYKSTTINGSLQSGIQQLLNENAINPSDTNRKIPGLRFIWNNDSRLDDYTITATFLGDNLLKILEDYGKLYDVGFRIIFNEENTSFDFSLYCGEDRSYDQEKNPWVVFSAAYNNLVGSNYFESFANLKTAAVITSQADEIYGIGIVEINGRPNMTGLNRRELYVNATDIKMPKIEVNETAISEAVHKQYDRNSKWTEKMIEEEIQNRTNAAYIQSEIAARLELDQLLKERGNEELAKTYITKSFEGEIEGTIQYIYGRDFFIGDLVQVRNRYGKEASSRITEVIRSHDANGEILTPTFTTLIGSDNEGDITNPDL